MALSLVSRQSKKGKSNAAIQLYRHMTKNIPRVLTLYDINMEPKKARRALGNIFRSNADVKDARVIDMLVTKGRMELEETLMQWKQKTHLITLLEDALPDPKYEKMDPVDIAMEKFFAGEEEHVEEADEIFLSRCDYEENPFLK